MPPTVWILQVQSSVCFISNDQFPGFYHGQYRTDNLVKDAKDIISQNQGPLGQDSSDRYRLDELLSGMLCRAPGQQYVAVVLLIAIWKGTETVVEAARAWLEYLVFPSQFKLM
jgi:hypothetical protein